jgi:hypothetical protein
MEKLDDSIMCILMKQDIRNKDIRYGQLMSDIDELKDNINTLKKLTRKEIIEMNQDEKIKELHQMIDELKEQNRVKDSEIKKLRSDRDLYMARSLHPKISGYEPHI